MIVLYSAVDDPQRPLYRRDMMNVCCEAREAEIIFGYKKKWISPTAVAQLEMHSLKGDRQALIVLVEVKDGNFKLHPVRLATIQRADDEGTSIRLTLKLGGFASYTNTAETNLALQEKWSGILEKAEVPRTKDWLNAHPGAMSFYVSRIETEGLDDFKGTWLRLVNYMREREGLEDATFMAPVSADGSEVPHRLFPGVTYESGRAVVKIERGKSHEIVLRMIPSLKGIAGEPVLSIQNSAAKVAGPFLLQHSEGLEATFVLTFVKSFEDESARIAIALPRAQSGAHVSPEHQALLRVGIPPQKVWAAFLVMFVGTLMTTYATALFPKAPTATGPEPRALALQILGTIMLGFAGFVVYKKFPKTG